MSVFLELNGLSKAFGGLQVIRDVSLTVDAGSRTALIGPNGAGKSTLFNLISGVYTPDSGTVVAEGEDITHLMSRRRIRHGIARSFQNIRLMRHLTVAENLLLGQHVRAGGLGALLAPFRLAPKSRWKTEIREALAEARLSEFADAPVGALPYGMRKRVDLVRATLARPKLLMLDEPAAGLNPAETDELTRELIRISETGVALFVVEHDMKFVGAIAERIIALNFGEKIAEGTMREVQADPLVRQAYLGGEGHQENAA